METDKKSSLLVLCDSLSYFGPRGGLPADDPRIWPSIVAKELNLDSEIIGRLGWTMRDGYWALIQDPRVWAYLRSAKYLVIALGGMDTLPSPLPTALRESIRYLRPPKVRRWVREVYGKAQPILSQCGWPKGLPPKLTEHYLDEIYHSVKLIRPDLPIIVSEPATHCAPSYGGYLDREPTANAVTRWAEKNDCAVIDFYSVIKDYVDQIGDVSSLTPDDVNDDLLMNADGIHWGFAAHRDIATLVLNTIRQHESERLLQQVSDTQ